MLQCNIYCTFVSNIMHFRWSEWHRKFLFLSHVSQSPKQQRLFKDIKGTDEKYSGIELKEFTLYCQTIKYLFIRFPTLFTLTNISWHHPVTKRNKKKLQKDFLLFLAVFFLLFAFIRGNLVFYPCIINCTMAWLNNI